MVNPQIARIAVAAARLPGPGQNALQEAVGGVGAHEEGRQVDGRTEKDLSPLAFRDRVVGNVGVGHGSAGDQLIGEGHDQRLQAAGGAEIPVEALEQAVVAALRRR